ncbi:YggT family protein [Vagococcus acidifermentans]|uniref:YggT family protein n=1 Tax=Vagococcus acidifermentans TaxID=564710 RepID=UPI001FE3AACF|nr:YggT family protein [Vagococcus acidifermentans]
MIFVYKLFNLLFEVVHIYSIILVIYALLSWFPGAYDTALGRFIIKISRPYLSLFDHLNLSFGPIDFTIIVAILALELSSQGLYLIVSRIMFGLLY